MERIDQGVQEAAEALRTKYPHAAKIACTFAPAVQQSGVLRAWADLMGAADGSPDLERRQAYAQLRDGLAVWFSGCGAPASEPKVILAWLIHEQSPRELDLLRERMLPLLQHLHTSGNHEKSQA